MDAQSRKGLILRRLAWGVAVSLVVGWPSMATAQPASVHQSLTTAVAAATPVNGLLLFRRSGDLYTVRADGTGVRRLTTTGGVSSGQWSPDGSRIALTRAGDVYTMTSSGTGLQRVTTHAASDDSPTWSPDGGQLAFHSNRRGTTDVYRIKSSPPYGTPVRLTTSGTALPGSYCDFDDFRSPRWNPVNHTIALIHVCGYEYEQDDPLLEFVNASDGSPVAGTPSRLATAVEWAPRGTKLAYTNSPAYYDEYPYYRIYQTTVEGTASNLVAPCTTSACNISVDATSPTWAPDGTRIAYQGRNGSIWLAKPDGSIQTFLLSNGTPLDWKAQ
jgi:Tol biopolymer transport system component